MKLRDYQSASHDAAWKHWGAPEFAGIDLRERYAAMLLEMSADPFAPPEQSEKRLVINSPTGSGKTLTAAAIIQTAVAKGMRCLYVGDTDELCSQPVEKFAQFDSSLIVHLEKASQRASMHGKVVVTSMQTMKGDRLARWPANHFDLILLDEIHRGTPAKIAIADHFRNAMVAGFTGTALRGRGDLSAWLPLTAFNLDTLDLVEMGYLVPFRVLPIPLDLDTSKATFAPSMDGGVDVTLRSAAEIIEPAHRAMVKVFNEHLQDRRAILTFHPLRSTSDKFVTSCLEGRITAKHCEGRTEGRSTILEEFERGAFRVLSNAITFAVGVDFLRADTLVNFRLTRSIPLFRQMCGRIFRPLPGIIDGLATAEERRAAIAASAKPYALIVDILGQAAELGIAGPADLVDNPPPELRSALQTGTLELDFKTVRKNVEAERERKLLAEIKRRAKKKENLKDARELGILLHDPTLTHFTPIHPWERRPISRGQSAMLEARGIDPETVTNRGMAAKVMEIFLRAKRGLAPIYAFDALRQKGIADPAKLTLDESIRILDGAFPVGFGKSRGKPVSAMEKGFWWSLIEKAKDVRGGTGKGSSQGSADWIWNFPAEMRYAAHATGMAREDLEKLRLRALRDTKPELVAKPTSLFGRVKSSQRILEI